MKLIALPMLAALATMPAFAQTPFGVGQEWKLQYLGGVSSFVIARIDVADGKTIIHGSLIESTTKPDVNGERAPSETHIPITEDALRNSVIDIQRTGAPQPLGFAAAYRAWQQTCGGAFAHSVVLAIAVAVTAQMSNRPTPYDIAGPKDCAPIS